MTVCSVIVSCSRTLWSSSSFKNIGEMYDLKTINIIKFCNNASLWLDKKTGRKLEGERGEEGDYYG